MSLYRPVYSGDPGLVQEFLRISAVLETLSGKLVVAYSAPPKPREGQVLICDGVRWNPLGTGKQPVWFDGTNWRAF